MADRIVFNYTDIQNSVTKIKQYAKDLQIAGDTLINSLDTALEGADGASIQKFKILINDSFSRYAKTDIPKSIQQIAEVLQKNAEAMQQSDEEIAKGIPDKL